MRGEPWGGTLDELSQVMFARGAGRRRGLGARRNCLIARRLGDSELSGWLMNVSGKVARARGDFPGAVAFFEEQLSTSEWLDDKPCMVVALLDLTFLARAQRDSERAVAGYHRLVAVCRDMGDTATAANALRNLGDFARFKRAYPEAMELYDRSLRLFEGCHMASDAGWVRRCQAEILAHEGALEKARELYVDGIERGADRPLVVMLCAAGLASLCAALAEDKRALALTTCIEALDAAHGQELAPEERALFEERQRQVLGKALAEALVAARRTSQGMSRLSTFVTLSCSDGGV